jgi:hypothetical protein
MEEESHEYFSNSSMQEEYLQDNVEDRVDDNQTVNALTLSQMFIILMAMMKLLLQMLMKTNVYMMNIKMISNKLLHQHT